MSSDPDEADRGVVLARALGVALLMLVIIVLLGAALLVISAPAEAEPNITWWDPQPDTAVSRNVDIVVRASTNVTGVSFHYKPQSGPQVPIGNGTFSPPDYYSKVWDTRLVSDGRYELFANASLAGGGYETITLTGIRVDNTIPLVLFKNPSDGIRLKGLYRVEVQAGLDVVSVDLYIDTGSGYVALGSAQNVAGTMNWTFDWDTTSFADVRGIDLLASGKDEAGNEGRATVWDIHVDNMAPTATLDAPKAGAVLDGYVHLRGNTSEAYAVDLFFEWREQGGEWQRIGNANWNGALHLWTLQWNTYLVGEHSEVEVRFTVVDDLGMRGSGVASGINITDLPPRPEFLTPLEGEHLTGEVDLRILSQNDTVSMVLEFYDGTEWVGIGQASQEGAEVWGVEWDTAGISLRDTTIRATSYDATGSGYVLLSNIEVDNTHPAPQMLRPTVYEYNLYGTVDFVVLSDMDTVAISLYYLEDDEYIFFADMVYNANSGYWVATWNIPDGLYIPDSAICATAVDEVGLEGTFLLRNREINLPPGDYAPRFLTTMAEVIYIDEDQRYMLDLKDDVDDDDKSTVKVYVTQEPKSLFFVNGENVTGNLVLEFVTLPDRNGRATVTVHVVDKSGQHDSTQLLVIVNSVADPPRFFSIPPPLYARPEVAYTFDFLPYIEDVDSPLNTLVILKPDDNHVSKVASNPLALEFLYSKGELGKTFYVNVTVRDPDGLIASVSVLMRVVDDWVPELRKPLPDVWMDEDEDKLNAFSLDSFFHDQDQDALYYSYGNRYVRVVIGNEYPHPVSIYPPLNWYGTDTVTFRATDPTGALVEDTIIVRCNSTNDAPYFIANLPIPQLVIRANESYDFDLSPYVVDVDHELGDLTITTSNPLAIRSPIFTLGIRLTYPKRAKPYILDVTVTDPDGASSGARTINVLVSDNYPPYLRNPPPDLEMNEGEILARVFNVTDVWDPDWDDGPAGSWRDLTFLFVCSDAKFTVNANGWVDVALLDPDFNTYNESTNKPLLVLLRVMDEGEAFSEYTFRLSVKPVNDAPVVDEIGMLEITPSIVTIDLRNYVRDVDTPFSGLRFEYEDATDPSRVISYVGVHGWLLVLDYTGSTTRTDRLIIWVQDQDHRVATQLTVKVTAKEEQEAGVAWWMILLVVVATGSVAVVASRFVWGRFEPPSVSDVFLVYGDGVIIRHMSKRGTMSMDEDLAIAMLTAIQEFVQQSMRSAQLKSMQAGEHNILIERDPSKLFYIAVIHTGSVIEELRKAINYATRAIKEDYGNVLKKWDGNVAKFDGVERHLDQILAISHAAIPEGVRFEMEGITSIEPGKTYLFQGKDVTRTHNIFRGLVEDSDSGLLISRVHPQRLHPSVIEAGADCIWLSKTPTKRGVSPSNTTMILHEITTFVREHPRTVVCLDGLEYLLVHNPLDEVVSFVSELIDMVQVDDFIMMIHVDPYALDDATLAKLSRNMVPVTDRTPANGR